MTDPIFLADVKGYEGLYGVTDDGNVYSFVRDRFLKSNKQFGYPMVALSKKDDGSILHRVHRLMAEAYIPNPKNLPCVDHIDRNRSNNNLINLRWASHEQNAANVGPSSRSSSKYKGVKWCEPKNAWKVTIKVDKKPKIIGYFVDELKAAKAYNDAVIMYKGYSEFNYLNTIPGYEDIYTHDPTIPIITSKSISLRGNTFILSEEELRDACILRYTKEMFYQKQEGLAKFFIEEHKRINFGKIPWVVTNYSKQMIMYKDTDHGLDPITDQGGKRLIEIVYYAMTCQIMKIYREIRRELMNSNKSNEKRNIKSEDNIITDHTDKNEEEYNIRKREIMSKRKSLDVCMRDLYDIDTKHEVFIRVIMDAVM